ncbi:DUF3450 family protein [Cohnella rhizosphaerae]|uniref:DUF3450 family protein n=1 Tax=Cohnella rhizosphaerae TaxID=1457232 RepID=A0A9X4KUE9_9BACL|nr:DUF3450 family protein [Cohnella rhizosphaerae]MDG0808372.1 DUF3450 family protein [Cohnella rhizosphaerae]
MTTLRKRVPAKGRRRALRSSLLTAACAVFLFAYASSEAAAATMYDRFKDIYQTPEKVDELRDQYIESQQKLQEQTDELNRRAEEMQNRTEQYQAETEALNARNEALAAQNAALNKQLADMTEKQKARAALTRKTVYSVAAVLGAGILYLLTIRLWRYSVWRRQRSGSWRT